MFVYDFSGTNGPISICPDSGLTVFGENHTVGNLYVKIDPTAQRYPTTLAAYPVGFTTTFIAPYNKGNWVIQADPTWNTLTANVPVGAGGVTLQMNAEGLFTLIPTLSGIEGTPLAYTAGGPATPVTATLALSDADSTTLAGATVQISGNYQNGQDLLSFLNTANITGSWNAATGTLTLSGNDTLADYQAALRAVQYVNTTSDPNTATRTVSFQINDGPAQSNVAVAADHGLARR